MTDRPIHPACAAWPRPPDDKVREIADSIKAEGLHNPIWLFEGAILDGKTRYEACQMAGVEPIFQTYAGSDPEKFTVSQNAARRHLSPGALALIVAELHKVKNGGDRGNQYTGGREVITPLPHEHEANTLADLADEAGLDRSMVVGAKSLLQHAEPNVLALVRNKQVGVRAAAGFALETPREEQRKAESGNCHFGNRWPT
jgi:ParB/Sulfiredoxin domain